jgi:hypothetical protein
MAINNIFGSFKIRLHDEAAKRERERVGEKENNSEYINFQLSSISFRLCVRAHAHAKHKPIFEKKENQFEVINKVFSKREFFFFGFFLFIIIRLIGKQSRDSVSK